MQICNGYSYPSLIFILFLHWNLPYALLLIFFSKSTISMNGICSVGMLMWLSLLCHNLKELIVPWYMKLSGFTGTVLFMSTHSSWCFHLDLVHVLKKTILKYALQEGRRTNTVLVLMTLSLSHTHKNDWGNLEESGSVTAEHSHR